MTVAMIQILLVGMNITRQFTNANTVARLQRELMKMCCVKIAE